MILRSPFPDVDIPEVPLSSLILERARHWGDKTALIDGPTGRKISYGELASLIERFASGLSRRGFKKGDCFAIFSPNLPEYVVALIARMLFVKSR